MVFSVHGSAGHFLLAYLTVNIRALSLLKKNKEENTVTYQESPPWLLTMFKTPCVEIILYPEFSRSNRQANKSSRTMDAGNHRLLQTSSPAYYSFLETTENYTLQIQRKNQVCSRPRVPRHRVHVPESTSPRLSPAFSHSPKSLICGETWFTYQTWPRHQ